MSLADVEKPRYPSDGFKIVPRDSDTIWMKAQDVDTWLSQRLELHRDQRRVFGWEDFFSNETRQME